MIRYVLGVRRQTTAEDADRWAAECRPRLSGGESVAALTQMLTGAADAGWPVLVVGPPGVADDAQNERITELDAHFTPTCADRGVPYISVVATLVADPTWRAEVLVRPGWSSWLAN